MKVWLLIVTIAKVPLGSQYETREECEADALRIHVALLEGGTVADVECVERVKRGTR